MKKKKRMSITPKNEKREMDRRLLAFLSVFTLIFGFLIAWRFKRNDKYIMYYAKHGLVLFIFMVIILAIGQIDFVIFQMISAVLLILFIIVLVFAAVNALSGEERRTTLVTEIAQGIKI